MDASASSSTASTSTMSTPRLLPASNTLFSSFDEFKLAAYKVGLHNRTSLVVRSSSPKKHVYIACPLIAALKGVTQCTYKVGCRRTPSGELRVSMSVNVHTCGEEQDEERKSLAEETMRERIKWVQEHPERPKPTLASYTVEEGSEDEEVQDPEASDDEMEETTTEEKLVHSAVCAIADEVNTLADGARLTFPSPSANLVFTSHTSLRVHSIAAALQRGFSMYLRNTTKTSSLPVDRFTLNCHLNHTRFTQADFEKCGAFIKAIKRSDGSWTVSEASLKHSHPLKPGEWHFTASGTRKRSRAVNEEDDSVQECDMKNLTSSITPPAKRRGTWSVVVPSPSKPSTSVAHLPISHPAKLIPSPKPALPHPFLSSLRSFFYLLSPPLERLALQLISQGGLDSVNAIVSLLSLSEEGLEYWVTSLGVKKLEEMQLKAALRKVKVSVESSCGAQKTS